MKYKKRKSPATNEACKNDLPLKATSKPRKKQVLTDSYLEVTVWPEHADEEPYVIQMNGKHARSLKRLHECRSTGLTRMEAVEHFNILCLTQHVYILRHDFDLDIYTEELKPEKYARYHLISRISLRDISNGGLRS